MRALSLIVLASTAAAFSFPEALTLSSLFARGEDDNGYGGDDDSQCPDVWTDISKVLTKKFLRDGQCDPYARAAIRLVWHDCGAWEESLGATAGCDGSIVLNEEENSRSDNKGLQEISVYIKDLASEYDVSVADLVVYAANHATVTCPGGPRVKTLIGRESTEEADPKGLLPDVNASAEDLTQLFADKGLDETDLAALLGAHSTSNQYFFDEEKRGAPQDSTPGIWDGLYYRQTLNPNPGICVLPSDAKLAKYKRVGEVFRSYITNEEKWDIDYIAAMAKLELFGTDGSEGMVDCTDTLPKPTKAKRNLKNRDPFARRN